MEDDFHLHVDTDILRFAIHDPGHHSNPLLQIDIGDRIGELIRKLGLHHVIGRREGEYLRLAGSFNPAQVAGPALGTEFPRIEYFLICSPCRPE